MVTNWHMIRARMVANGSVQGVGYRYKVARIGQQMKLRGIVRNLEDGTVEIFCEADRKEQLNEFIKKIKESDFLMIIDKLEVCYEGQPGYASHPKQNEKFGIEY